MKLLNHAREKGQGAVTPTPTAVRRAFRRLWGTQGGTDDAIFLRHPQNKESLTWLLCFKNQDSQWCDLFAPKHLRTNRVNSINSSLSAEGDRCPNSIVRWRTNSLSSALLFCSELQWIRFSPLTLGRTICFSLLIQMLILFRYTLTDTIHIVFYQITWLPMTQLSWHIRLTTTKEYQGKYILRGEWYFIKTNRWREFQWRNWGHMKTSVLFF